MEQKEKAIEIVQTLRHAGYLALFAGGWVRDYLLGQEAPDIDIATDAPPEEVSRLFPHTVKVGASFGVVMVVLDEEPFEVATFRKDGMYLYGRRPESVEFSSPPEDAQRRDFTINGMFYDPIQDKILDFVDGQQDLRRGIVRAIGDPKARFQEDRLRMIRGVRLSARFGFTIEEQTEAAIKKQAHTLFPAVAVERVWQELQKMAAYSGMTNGLLKLYELSLLVQIFPDLHELTDDQIRQNIAICRNFPLKTPPVLYLVQLFNHDNYARQAMRCRYLRVSNEDMKWVKAYLKAKELFSEGTKDILQWVELYADSRYPILRDVYAATEDEGFRDAFYTYHELQRQNLRSAIERKRSGTVLVTSALLKEKGVTSGRHMGQLLRDAERIAIQLSLEDPQRVLNELQRSSDWPGEGGNHA